MPGLVCAASHHLVSSLPLCFVTAQLDNICCQPDTTTLCDARPDLTVDVILDPDLTPDTPLTCWSMRPRNVLSRFNPDVTSPQSSDLFLVVFLYVFPALTPDLTSDPQGEMVHKNVYIAFFQGDQLKSRVKKISEGFRATVYPCPETQTERREMKMGVMTRIEDLNTVSGGGGGGGGEMRDM